MGNTTSQTDIIPSKNYKKARCFIFYLQMAMKYFDEIAADDDTVTDDIVQALDDGLTGKYPEINWDDAFFLNMADAYDFEKMKQSLVMAEQEAFNSEGQSEND